MKKYISILFIIMLHFGFAADLSVKSFHQDIFTINASIQNDEKAIMSPNPAMEKTTISVLDKSFAITQVSVYSLLGNQIFSQDLSGNETSVSLNVQSFKKGKYLVKITFKNGFSEVKALIKQ